MDTGDFRGTRFLITDVCTSTKQRPGRGGSDFGAAENDGAVKVTFKNSSIGPLSENNQRLLRWWDFCSFFKIVDCP